MKKHYVQNYTKLRLEWINENNDETYSAGMALIHTREKKLYIVALMLVQGISGFNGVLEALLLRSIVDCAVAGDNPDFWRYMFMMLFLMTTSIALRAVIRWLTELAKATLENTFKARLTNQLLHRDYASVNAIHSGEWMNRLTNDTIVVADGYVDILPGLVEMVVKLISALVMIVALDARLASILIPAGIIAIATSYSFRRILKRLHKSIQESDGRLRVFLQERISSMMVIHSFAAEEQTEREARGRMDTHKADRMRRVRFSNIINIGFGSVMDGIYLFGIGYCSYGILTGTISYGTLTALIQLIRQIQAPFSNISGYLPKYYAMLASAERLMEIEDYTADDVTWTLELDDVRNYYDRHLASVGLKEVTFTYYPAAERLSTLTKEGMPLALDGVSLKIKKGDYVAFTGRSGCGKSTAMKLLMGAYNPDTGERYIEDLEEKKQHLDMKWRRLFAYVPQDNQLMSGSVREIVSFANASWRTDDAAIGYALKIACADFIDELDDGIDTTLGERGTGLSEGQMQRLAVARAVFSQSPILLLDEATSALDEATERKLLENLKGLKNRTIIIVTHRPAALAICNRVVRFSDEGILEA